MGEYGVLLPVQIETRFIPPGTSAEQPLEPDPDQPDWRLRLRVVPDRASITVERITPSPAELVALQALWSTLANDDGFPDPLPTDRQARRDALCALAGWTDAFARLTALVGPARAAGLVDTVETVGSPPQVPTGGTDEGDADGGGWVVPTVRGLPADLDVWVLWTGWDDDAPAPQPEVIATLHPAAGGLSLDPVPAGEDDPLSGRWWDSWEGALDAGLATEVVLGRDPSEIEVLGVSGLGTGLDAAAGALFASHAQAGDLAVLRPGVPTSTVFGSETVDIKNVSFWAGPRGSDGHGVLGVLAGQGHELDVPVDPLLGVHEEWTRRIVSACYPALWGYGLQSVSDCCVSPGPPSIVRRTPR